jgi:hypothetical protein
MRYDLMNDTGLNGFSSLTPEEKTDLYMQPKKY